MFQISPVNWLIMFFFILLVFFFIISKLMFFNKNYSFEMKFLKKFKVKNIYVK